MTRFRGKKRTRRRNSQCQVASPQEPISCSIMGHYPCGGFMTKRAHWGPVAARSRSRPGGADAPCPDLQGIRQRHSQRSAVRRLAGCLPPGSSPSTGRVARNTVDDALAQLQAEGFVERKVGAGSFVAASIPGRRAPAPALRRAPSVPGLKLVRALSQRGFLAFSEYRSGGMPRPQPFFAGLPDLDQFPRSCGAASRCAGCATAGARSSGTSPRWGMPACARQPPSIC